MGECSARRRLAENLRLLRLLRGWSQEDLAAAARIDRSYVSGLERAQRNVGLDTLDRLARSLGLDVTDLLRTSDAREIGECLLATIRRALDPTTAEPDVPLKKGV